MLMWEIFAGHPPFYDRAHNHILSKDICEGLRPPILRNMPDECVKIMKACWDTDPSKRPDIKDITYSIVICLDNVYPNEVKYETSTSNTHNGNLQQSLSLAYHT